MPHKIKIDGKEVTLHRLKLKEWSKLESVKKDIDDAASKDDYQLLFRSMVNFIEAVISSPSEVNWERLPWYEFVDVYSKAVEINSPTIEFPILRGSKKEDKKLPWEYDGRSWYFWLNLFARRYGWVEQVIAEMDVDDALGLYQETSLDEQLEYEFLWGLSEVSYPYDNAPRKNKFVPMPRPD